MHNPSYTQQKQTYIHSSIPHVHYIHQSANINAEMKQSIILILNRIRPATSYVTATFHPTIGQCTHQSLSNIATLELEMISSRNKGIVEDSYINKVQQNSSKPTQLGLSGCKGKQTNRWVSMATQPSHLIVGFHILFTVKTTFPLSTSQSNIWVYQIVHSQSISLLGLSGYLAKLVFTVGFIRLSSQRLLTNSNTTRNNQANRWFYRATSQDAYFQLGLSRF